jgi:hypothetical protein
MVHEFAYSLVFGKPIIMYGGIVTYLLLLLTASVAVLNVKYGVHVVPFKWHPPLAILTIVAGTVHAILGMSLYLNF